MLSVEQLKQMADIPMTEIADPNFQAPAWGGVVAPAATPKAIVDRLSAEIHAVTVTQDFREGLLRLSNIPVGSTPEEFRQEMDANMKTWSRVAQGAGVKPD